MNEVPPEGRSVFRSWFDWIEKSASEKSSGEEKGETKDCIHEVFAKNS